jgi:hypothetical protein
MTGTVGLNVISPDHFSGMARFVLSVQRKTAGHVLSFYVVSIDLDGVRHGTPHQWLELRFRVRIFVVPQAPHAVGMRPAGASEIETPGQRRDNPYSKALILLK